MHHEHHHLELHKILHDKMSKVYFFNSMFFFVKSLIGIFIPLYLYSIGIELWLVIFITGLYSILFVILIPFATKIIKHLGFKKSLLISYVIYISHLFFINYVKTTDIFLLLSIITFGMYMALFWLIYHSEIVVNSNKKHMGSQIGTLHMLTSFFTAIGPLIGGFVLEIFEYEILLFISLIFVFLGTIPLLLAEDIRLKKYDVNFKDYINFIKSNTHKKSKIAFISQGIELTIGVVLWPIILYIILDKNFLLLGTIMTAVTFLTVIIIVYFKKSFDKKNKIQILKTSVKALSFQYFLKNITLFLGTILIMLIEGIARLIREIMNITYFSIFYKNATKNGYMDYIAMREFLMHTTKFIFTTFIAVLFLLFNPSLTEN